MAERYFDPDPPPPGSPRLLGDIGALGRYRKTVEERASGSPMASSPFFHRNLIFAAAVFKMGYSQRQVAEFFGLSESRLSHILADMENVLPTPDPSE